MAALKSGLERVELYSCSAHALQRTECFTFWYDATNGSAILVKLVVAEQYVPRWRHTRPTGPGVT